MRGEVAYLLVISIMVLCATILFIDDRYPPAIAILIMVALSSYRSSEKKEGDK